MCDDGKGSGGATRVQMTWRRGFPFAYGSENAHLADATLVTKFEGSGLGSGSALLRVSMTPVVRTFVGVGVPDSEVQSFRYIRPDGTPAMFCVCGCCGHVVHCAEEELGEFAGQPCPGCAAGASTERCASWHTWGSCLVCPSAAPMPWKGTTARDGLGPALARVDVTA